jgi:hypothetical protein
MHAAFDQLVETEGAIDLRSSGYSQMYRASTAAAARLTRVRVTGPDGVRAAASYQGKVAKGRLTRAMLIAGAPSVESLLRAATEIGVDAEGNEQQIVVRLPPGWGLVGNEPAD